MKKSIFISFFLLILSFYCVAQKEVNNPGVILDTVYNDDHFIFSWSGDLKLLTADSVYNDSLGSRVDEEHLSVLYSYVGFTIHKQRIVNGDTIRRVKIITLPIYEVSELVDKVFMNKELKLAIIKSLEGEFKKKLSQE